MLNPLTAGSDYDGGKLLVRVKVWVRVSFPTLVIEIEYSF
jgi:hypothetical protein